MVPGALAILEVAAGVLTRTAPVVVPADVDPCALLAAGLDVARGGGCRTIATQGRDVRLYRVDATDRVRLAFVVAASRAGGDERLMSPPMDVPNEVYACSSLVKVTPRLRALSREAPTFALDVTTLYAHACETWVDTERWTGRRFAACGAGLGKSAAWSCVSAELGAFEAPCTATLSDGGTLTHSCAESESIELP